MTRISVTSGLITFKMVEERRRTLSSSYIPENQRKQKEAADEVLKEYRGILTFLRATIKKDPKYIERVSKQLELEIEKDYPDLS